jgi:hypothetical protein
MDASDPRYPVVQELLAYWLAHPDASDTLDGICRWWLTGARYPESLVDQTLVWLVEHGTVVAHRAADGRVRYRLAGTSRGGPS